MCSYDGAAVRAEVKTRRTQCGGGKRWIGLLTNPVDVSEGEQLPGLTTMWHDSRVGGDFYTHIHIHTHSAWMR